MQLKLKKLAVAAVAVFSAAGFLHAGGTARIPVVVNVDAMVSIVPPAGSAGAVGVTNRAMSAGVQEVLEITLEDGSAVLYRPQRMSGAPASASYGKGRISLELHPQAFGSAQVSLFSVSGRRVLRGSVSAAKSGGLDISRPNVAKGVYLLSVKGAGGGSFTARVPHSGGRLGISVAFGGGSVSLGKGAVSAAEGWTITASAAGYADASLPLSPVAGDNSLQTVTLTPAGAGGGGELITENRYAWSNCAVEVDGRSCVGFAFHTGGYMSIVTTGNSSDGSWRTWIAGNWTASGNKVTMVDFEKNETTVATYSVSGDKLSLVLDSKTGSNIIASEIEINNSYTKYEIGIETSGSGGDPTSADGEAWVLCQTRSGETSCNGYAFRQNGNIVRVSKRGSGAWEESAGGTWAVSGNILNITSTSGKTTPVFFTVSGNTLAMQGLVYTKQSLTGGGDPPDVGGGGDRDSRLVTGAGEAWMLSYNNGDDDIYQGDIFLQNGDYQMAMCDNPVSRCMFFGTVGTWSTSGNVLTIARCGEAVMSFTYSVSGDNMTIIDSRGPSNVTKMSDLPIPATPAGNVCGN